MRRLRRTRDNHADLVGEESVQRLSSYLEAVVLVVHLDYSLSLSLCRKLASLDLDLPLLKLELRAYVLLILKSQTSLVFASDVKIKAQNSVGSHFFFFSD